MLFTQPIESTIVEDTLVKGIRLFIYLREDIDIVFALYRDIYILALELKRDRIEI